MRTAPLFPSILVVTLLGCDAQTEPTPIRETTPPVEEPAPTIAGEAPMRPASVVTGPGGCADKTLTSVRGNQVLRLGADGSEQLLFTFGAAAGLPADNIVLQDWLRSGRFTAFTAFLWHGDNDFEYELVVLGDDGNVLLHSIRREPHNPSVFLGADGSLTVSGGRGYILHLDGSESDLGARWPVSALRADGHVLVALGEPWLPDAQYQWLHVATGATIPVATTEYGNFQALGDGMLHERFLGNGTRGLAFSTPASTSVFDLGLPPDGYFSVIGTGEGRFVLVSTADRTLHLDVATGALHTLALPDERPTQGYQETIALLPGGAVARSFVLDDGRLQLRRTDDFGFSWSDVGDAMAPGEDFGLGSSLWPVSRGGRTLVLNFSYGYGAYLNSVQLVSSSGSTQHVEVGGLYVNMDTHPGAADLSSDGACAATWVQREGTVFDEQGQFDLVVIDGARGESDVVATRNDVSAVRFP